VTGRFCECADYAIVPWMNSREDRGYFESVAADRSLLADAQRAQKQSLD
jgi:hypothetical protein